MTEIKAEYLTQNNLEKITIQQLADLAIGLGCDLEIKLTPIHKHDPEVVIDPENNSIRMVCKECGKTLLLSELESESCS